MRKMVSVMAIVMIVALVVVGCGKKKDEKDVVKGLEQALNKLESYEASGSMLLHTGMQPLEYEVEVWYKNPHYYRIALTNAAKDITQIVLRNDEGVFILTPHLNKSIRFQSNWPDEQGQVYLYQTLVHSILKDEERLFTIDDERAAYVFDVVADYDNSTFARQKIWLNEKTYAPEHVEIVDEQKSVIVVVEFDHFAFGKEFEQDSFDRERNLTSWSLSTHPVFALLDDEVSESRGGVIFPSYVPDGVVQTNVKDLMLGDTPAVLIMYEGDYNYTLVESAPSTQEVSILPMDVVDVVDMQFTVGMLTGDEAKMLRWVYDGVEYRLSSSDLPKAEMINIAQSVQGQIGK